jgi:hypothetical protein
VTVAKKPGAPRRAQSKPLDHRAGKAGSTRLSLWFLPRAFPVARGPRVPAGTRPSLHPLTSGGSCLAQFGCRMRRENARSFLFDIRHEMGCDESHRRFDNARTNVLQRRRPFCQQNRGRRCSSLVIQCPSRRAWPGDTRW